ncbi:MULTISPECIES: glutathione S-transferase family protein [unclassified Francisella]|uniref:glutathione S-transferase family protein n=1 Tax=unclassified Francisella TaxID=2610885 RepID=UPI002E35E370|nr:MULTISPECIES: glutathione S-transferase family protein [unclassified Francisella]MED7819727.1 glutathione S-transferase family protein [Francisella sp. 19S2-4]MED7830554.1 glutathione S-transferase family protein [Francisella sp. 19S2-10]
MNEFKYSAQDLKEKIFTQKYSKYASQKGVHLYHFPGSLYSQIARQALVEKNAKYESHIILVNNACQQYDPEFVRISPLCVVPILVIDGKVTNNAYNIAQFVDKYFSINASLFPIDKELQKEFKYLQTLVDRINSEVLTFGDVSVAKRPFLFRYLSKNGHQHKIEILEKRIKEYSDDLFLRLAFENKLKTVAKTNSILRDSKLMEQTLEDTKQAISKLGEYLENHEGEFALGKEFSAMDIYLGIFLWRLDFLNLGEYLWGDSECIKKYTEALWQRETFKQAVIKPWKQMQKDILIPVLISKLKSKLGFKS